MYRCSQFQKLAMTDLLVPIEALCVEIRFDFNFGILVSEMTYFIAALQRFEYQLWTEFRNMLFVMKVQCTVDPWCIYF